MKKLLESLDPNIECEQYDTKAIKSWISVYNTQEEHYCIWIYNGLRFISVKVQDQIILLAFLNNDDTERGNEVNEMIIDKAKEIGISISNLVIAKLQMSLAGGIITSKNSLREMQKKCEENFFTNIDSKYAPNYFKLRNLRKTNEFDISDLIEYYKSK